MLNGKDETFMNIFHIGVKVYEICFLFIDVMVLIDVYSLVGMKMVRIFSDRIRNRICLEGLRSVRIRVRISNIRYRIHIRILKSYIYDVDIQSYHIRHS